MFEDTVHDGGSAGRGCQWTVTLAGAPAPDPLMPATLYVCTMAAAEVATHDAVELAQPVQT